MARLAYLTKEDLVAMVAIYNGVVPILESLEIDVEPKYQAYLEDAFE